MITSPSLVIKSDILTDPPPPPTVIKSDILADSPPPPPRIMR